MCDTGVMTHHIIKPLPDEDFYCDWDVETNHPEVWGDRAYMVAQGADELRLRRADRQGSSCWDGYRRWTEESPDDLFPMELGEVHPDLEGSPEFGEAVVSVPRHALRTWLTTVSPHGDENYDLAAVQYQQNVDFYDQVPGANEMTAPPIVDYRPLVKQAEDESVERWLKWVEDNRG